MSSVQVLGMALKIGNFVVAEDGGESDFNALQAGRVARIKQLQRAERVRVAGIITLDRGYAAMRAAEGDRLLKIMPDEVAQHAPYDEGFVTHVETNTKAQTRRNRQQSSLILMRDNGTIDDDQYASAIEIAQVIEGIERAVSVRGASLEARVDNAGAGCDVLVERLSRVRLEMSYSEWRRSLPMPRRMILDMLIADRALKVTARTYGMGWPRAKGMLLRSLNYWPLVKDRVWARIDERDVEARYLRIGGGVVL